MDKRHPQPLDYPKLFTAASNNAVHRRLHTYGP